MTRLGPASPGTRLAFALAGTAGLAAVLAGCASPTSSTAEAAGGGAGSGDNAARSGTDASPSSSAFGTAQYKDGTYTASGTYQTPQSVEQVSVTLTLADDTVTAVEVTGEPRTSETVRYQGEFIAGISDAVVGRKIEDLAVTRVGGSSLTSAGFNAALARIEAQAKG